MELQHKLTLAERVQDWLTERPENTQATLARKAGISQTNLSHIAGNRWEDKVIGDAQWQKLAVFFQNPTHIDSPNFLNITGAAQMAQEQRRIIGIDGYTGAGKSYALEQYWKSKPNVFLIRARRSMGGKTFMKEVARQIGCTNISGQLYDIENAVIQRVKSIQGGPVLLILDEIEYLKPLALDSVKVLLQELDGVCGIVVCGIIRQWLEKLSGRNIQGMPQFLRRLGHSWVQMAPISSAEVRSFARANGITNKEVINCLVRDCRDYDALQKYTRDLIRVSQEDGSAITPDLYNELFHFNYAAA